MVNKQYLFFPIIFLVSGCISNVDNHDSNSNESEIIMHQICEDADSTINDKFAIPDSISLDCQLNYSRFGETTFITKFQLTLNPTNAILNVEGHTLNKECTDIEIKKLQLTLKERVANCFRRLLFELYSDNDSSLKDSLPEKRWITIVANNSLSIEINLNNKHVKESFEVENTIATYGEDNIYPFKPQFEKLYKLIIAIILKAEDQFYGIGHKLDAPDWIVEEFNYDYYEPYNEE